MAIVLNNLEADGFEIHRAVFSATEVEQLRSEAERVAASVGSTCVRGFFHRSDLFRALAERQELTALTGPEVKPVRSILFDKTPAMNWPVAWHQDLNVALKNKVETPGYGPWSVKDGVNHVQPPFSVMEGMVTVRIHLDDTGLENGPLRVMPGSHRTGKFAGGITSSDEAGAVTCVCAAGDVMLMKPLILHSSGRALVPAHRRIIHIEYANVELLAPPLAWEIDC